MITFLIILTLIACFSLTGMFYWMYKSKDGELDLKKESWHFKLIHYMWDTELYEIKNTCPYYWSIIVSLILLIPYLAIRYIIVFPISKIPFYKLKLPNFNLKAKIWNKVPTITIPETKKEWFTTIYRKGSNIALWLFYIIVGVALLYILFTKAPLLIACVLLGTISFVIITLIIHVYFDEYDKYHIDHYVNLIKGLTGTIGIPFVLIYKLISLIFSKITGVYENNCPPIVWK